VSLLTLTERRAVLAPGGESFTFPGGISIPGRWQSPPVDELGVRGANPGATFCYEDVCTFQLGETVWRPAKSAEYKIRDMMPDGTEGMTFLELEAVA